jgi:hypothetical protein
MRTECINVLHFVLKINSDYLPDIDTDHYVMLVAKTRESLSVNKTNITQISRRCNVFSVRYELNFCVDYRRNKRNRRNQISCEVVANDGYFIDLDSTRNRMHNPTIKM